MKALLKYAILLALALVIGVYASGRLSLEDIAPVPAKREAAVAPTTSASIDEELDYELAQRLGSLKGWRAFLATHDSGVYAQTARAEVKRLLLAEKAPAPAAGEASNGASPDAKAANEAVGSVPRSSGPEVAAVTPDEICKRDEDRLARLRRNPSSDEAQRFADELGCEKLLPQFLALMKSWGDAVSAPAPAVVSNGASPDAKAVNGAVAPVPLSSGTEVTAPPPAAAVVSNGAPADAKVANAAADQAPTEVAVPVRSAAEVSNEATRDAKAVGEAARPGPPFAGTEVSGLTPDEICKRDEDRLARLRGNPSNDEAQRFADELGCEKLLPQFQRLMKSWGDAVSAPAPAVVSNGASPGAKAVSEAVAPAPLSSGTEVTAPPPAAAVVWNGAPADAKVANAAADQAPTEVAVPARPAAEVSNGATRDAKAVGEAARPGPPFAGTEVAGLTPDEICKRDEDRLARLRGDPSSDEAARFANELGCEKLRPQLQRLLKSLGQAVPAPAAGEVPNGASPDARTANEAVGPASPSPGTDVAKTEAARPVPPSPGPGVAKASPVVAANAAAPPPAQTSALQTSAPESAVRGVSDKEIMFGMAAPFSGASRELGRQMRIGVETAFGQINDAGGVNGRMLRLMAADDGYERTRTADAMQVLYDKDRVFGFIGNVGTPTAAVALPFALDHRALFFGAFTGASLLRRDPPDRYVFNYRASYAEETNAVVHYLVKVRRIQPKEIVVFAQQDSYGDSGYAGVQKAVRSLPGDNPDIVRLNYKRNTVDVQDAVDGLRAFKGKIKAVVMVASYRAAAKFIEKTRDLYPAMIYTNVSFVGSTALADELTLLGPRYAAGAIVTQVVPAINSYASIVLKYKEALAKYFPGEAPDYVSFEGYIDANILAEAVRRVGRDINTERLVDELERMHDFDLGLGAAVSFSSNEHQGSHKIWGTQLDQAGQYQPIDLE